MKLLLSTFASLVLLGTATLAIDTPSDVAVTYKFNKAPVNAMGITSVADLRGKPVIIDFWGTR